MIMVKAYAKINLGLKIVGQDESDGYHLLDMVEVPLELHDRIEITELPAGYDTIITCDDRAVPTDETNLVAKTMKVLKDKYKFKNNFRIHIHKIIPVGSGLGGGSADAAAVLHAMNKILKLKISNKVLCELGAKIGSDVPFCVLNTPCHITSKGEELSPITIKTKYKVILARPKEGLITKDVYKKYDEMDIESNGEISLLIEGLKEGNETLIKENLVNDLEVPACSMNKKILEAEKIIKDAGIDLVRMTGSGSCVFGLSKDAKKIEELELKLKKAGFIAFNTKIM